MKKKLLAILLSAAMCLSLAACGQKADESDVQDDQQTGQEEFIPASYSIAALKGPTAMGLVKLMQESENGETSVHLQLPLTGKLPLRDTLRHDSGPELILTELSEVLPTEAYQRKYRE